MNKHFLIFLLFAGFFVKAAELEVVLPVVQRLSIPETIKSVSKWATASLVFGAVDYYVQTQAPLQLSRDIGDPKIQDQGFGSRIQGNIKKWFLNKILIVGQLSTGLMCEQIFKNFVSVSSRIPAVPLGLSLEVLASAYFFAQKKGVESFYAHINNRVLSIANTFVFGSFVERGRALYEQCNNGLGFSGLQELPFLLPNSAKMFICSFLLGDKKIDFSLHRSIFLSFELTEYVVKGWSGKYHVNNHMKFSLHWLLVIPFFYGSYHHYKDTIMEDMGKSSNQYGSLAFLERNKMITIIAPDKPIKTNSYEYEDIDIKMDKNELFKKFESSYDKIEKNGRVRKKLIIISKTTEDIGPENKDRLAKKFKKFYDRLLKHYNIPEKKMFFLQKKIFLFSIVALIVGLCFHALLDAGFYWYSHHSKV